RFGEIVPTVSSTKTSMWPWAARADRGPSNAALAAARNSRRRTASPQPALSRTEPRAQQAVPTNASFNKRLESQPQGELHIAHGLGNVENLARGIPGIGAVDHEVGEIGDVENIEILPPELQVGALGQLEILEERPVVHLYAGCA